MESWGVARRAQVGALQCVGLGVLGGAMESVHLATSLKLPLSWARFVLLGLSDVVVMGVVGGVLGALAGVVHLVGPRRDASAMLSAQVALCTFLLTGLYLWQGAFWTATDGQQPIGAAAMAAMPIGFAGVAYFNARYGFRRAERKPTTVGWVPIAGFGAVLLVGIASLLAGSRDTGGTRALEGDDNLLIVTVDGLRRDQIGPGSDTPALDAMAREGIVYDDAVTPTPGARAANATVITGLHPLRHKVLGPEDRLGRAYRTLFEVLAAEGWATGGFVSAPAAAAASGLEQGFLTYDDDFGGVITGFSRINVVGHLLRALGIEGRARGASRTVGLFRAWLERHGDRPFAAWIHLADPRLAVETGTSPQEAVRAVDGAVGEALAALDEVGASERTLVIVAGTHGVLLGAHGGQANQTLYDEVVRVPFLLRAPGVEVRVPSVEAQVRLMDVANTALEWLELDRMDASEGVGLLDYATGARSKTIWCPLVGRDIDGDWLIGLRNNGVKYVRHPDGREELYDIRQDPAELRDLVGEQEAILEQARTLLSSDSARLQTLVGR